MSSFTLSRDWLIHEGPQEPLSKQRKFKFEPTRQSNLQLGELALAPAGTSTKMHALWSHTQGAAEAQLELDTTFAGGAEDRS